MTQQDWRHRLGNFFTRPIGRLLARTPITPDMLTWTGLLFAVGALVLLLNEQTRWAGVVVVAGALFDTLDGALARAANLVSRFGGILDSTLDRLTEGIVLIGIVFVQARSGSAAGATLAAAALVLSLTVSYIRARAEAAGIACSDGWFTRLERIVILAAGLIFDLIVPALIIITILSGLTAAQRLLVVWQRTRKQT